MASESKGNFIMISPHERMNNAPIAIFYIDGVSEEDKTEYYPIMSNFYDTVFWSDTGTALSNTLWDIFHNQIPPKALPYGIVNKINYNGTIYWLSSITDSSLTYRSITDPTTAYIQVKSRDDWATYTINSYNGEIG